MLGLLASLHSRLVLSATMSFFDKLPSDEFVGVLIFEQSSKSDKHMLLAWVYPTVDDTTRNVIASRISTTEPLYAHYKSTWHYSYPVSKGLPSTQLPHTSAFVVVVLSSILCPERFLPLAKTLADAYSATAKPTAVLNAWLSAFRTGTISKSLVDGSADKTLVWDGKTSDPSKVLKSAGLQPLLASLGVEAVLLWTAIVLKRRIAVFGERVPEIVKALRVLPQLAPHRLAVEVDKTGVTSGPEAVLAADPGVPLFPYVSLRNNAPVEDSDRYARVEDGVAAQIAELAGTQGEDGVRVGGLTYYIAGFTDPSIATRQDLWDVCIDLTSNAVAVAEHAKDDFVMTAAHKDVARALVLAIENEGATDASVSQVARDKTQALVDRIRGWFPEGVVQTTDGIAAFKDKCKEEGINPALERFLWSIALAEALRR